MLNPNTCATERYSAALFEPGRFFVEATTEIITVRQKHIFPGDGVLIDTDKAPIDGDMVLIGKTLLPWTGQDSIDGVAIQAHRLFR